MVGVVDEGQAASAQDVEAEVAAPFGPFVVLLARTAPTRRITLVRSGKVPTTSVRRRISRLRRSLGLLDQTWRHSAWSLTRFPERFASLPDARRFMADFVEGYNRQHRHTGIDLNTPAGVHYGHATAKAAQRAVVLASARRRNPRRFATTQDGKFLAIPATAWINQPAAAAETELAA